MSNEAGQDLDLEIAIYNPNGAASIIAFIIFLAVAAGFWIRHFRTEPRAKYMRPIRYGATFMAFGYLARFTRRDGISAWSWLFETLFILLSPCAFIAQVYVLLPRLAEGLGAENCLVVKGRALRWTFIVADLVTVLAQLAGTALTITFGDLVVIGKWLVTGALWVQLFFFISFITIFAIFIKRLHRSAEYRSTWTPGSAPLGGFAWRRRWTSLLIAMCIACCCMMVRSTYRVAEYTSGADSALAYSEAAFYILDGVMMLVLVGSFLVIWPPNCLEPRNLPTARPGVTSDAEKVRARKSMRA